MQQVLSYSFDSYLAEADQHLLTYYDDYSKQPYQALFTVSKKGYQHFQGQSLTEHCDDALVLALSPATYLLYSIECLTYLILPTKLQDILLRLTLSLRTILVFTVVLITGATLLLGNIINHIPNSLYFLTAKTLYLIFWVLTPCLLPARIIIQIIKSLWFGSTFHLSSWHIIKAILKAPFLMLKSCIEVLLMFLIEWGFCDIFNFLSPYKPVYMPSSTMTSYHDCFFWLDPLGIGTSFQHLTHLTQFEKTYILPGYEPIYFKISCDQYCNLKSEERNLIVYHNNTLQSFVGINNRPNHILYQPLIVLYAVTDWALKLLSKLTIVLWHSADTPKFQSSKPNCASTFSSPKAAGSTPASDKEHNPNAFSKNNSL